MPVKPSDKVRVGIIGCGNIAHLKHMPALFALENVELCAFCDLFLDRAERARAKFGTPDAELYTDYKKLLEDSTIDVVHVCTPNRSHSFISVDALEAGKHVMCEKPMAINAEEAKKMLDAARRTGKKLTIGYQERQQPYSLYMKNEAQKGTFGDIYLATAHAIRRRGVPTWGVFLNKEEQGGGPLIDIGTHALDLSLWMMDNYRPRYAVGTAYHKLNDSADNANCFGGWDPAKFTVEDSAFGFVVMENGATVNIESSWALNVVEHREACCTIAGTLAGADMVDDGLVINGVRDGRQYLTRIDFSTGGVAFFGGSPSDSPSVIEARQWIRAVTEDKDPCVLPEQAYCVSRILDAVYRSAATGDIVYFDNE